MATIVCVTGASGFIGTYIVQELLKQGYSVRGMVRSLKTPAQYAYLTSLPGANERLELLPAELLTEGSYDNPVAGAEYVIHTASPYVIDAKDPQADLVDPAVKGTLNLLSSCRKTDSVKRVVLTSSNAAITDSPEPGKIYSEKDWNEKSSLKRNPYYFSKTEAERAAWKFMEAQKPTFDLIVINPTVVIGPSLSPALNTSNLIFSSLLNGVYPAIMNLGWAFVDVRDVAKAHRLALETPEAKGRYLCANKTVNEREVVALLKKNGYTYKLPKLSMESGFGNILVKLMSYAQPSGTGSYLRTQVGREYLFDNRKIQQELGMEFIPVEQSILETTADVIQWGHVKNAMNTTKS